MKKLLLIVLIATLVTGLFPARFSEASGTLYYWYSDSYRIGWWETEYIKVYSEKLNSNNTFYFLDGITHATNQWSNALGITIVSGINSYYSNEPQITYYGGTISELSTVWDGDVSSTSTGHTHYIYYYDGPLCYNGYNYYSGEVMVNAIGYIVDMGNSLPQTKKTCTHELGHALGWMGHSSNNSDIMYLANSYVTSLTSRDINHLSQVY